MKAIFAEADKIQVDRDAYGLALRDWAEFGSTSRFVLSPEEIIARSGRRDEAVAESAGSRARLFADPPNYGSTPNIERPDKPRPPNGRGRIGCGTLGGITEDSQTRSPEIPGSVTRD